MKKSTKALLTALCAILLVVTSVMGTLAYLTDKDDVLNTFTAGDVQIKLDEANVNEYGQATGDRNENGNAYRLLPGHQYTKDPIVTVLANSEDCYVRMKVTVSDMAALKAAFPADYFVGEVFLLQNLVDWNTNWEYKSYDNGTYEFWYNAKVLRNKEQAQELPALFTTITIPGTLTNANIAALNEIKISIVAEAIQADTFADAAAAWDAWTN